MLSTLPLTWPALCGHVRRRWFDAHRGEVPARRSDLLPGSAPLAIAACMQLSAGRHRFATESEAETFRWIAPRAQNAVMYWQFACEAREQVRVILDGLHYWCGHRRVGERRWDRRGAAPRNAVQAELDAAELRRRWQAYRAMMRRQAGQTAWVREALTPRPVIVHVSTLQAAE